MIERIPESIRRHVLENNYARRIFREGDTAESLDELILAEKQELLEEMQAAYIGGSATPLVFECADIFILGAKRYQFDLPVSKQVRGALHLAFNVCDLIGADPGIAMLAKDLRNDQKYPLNICNNGYEPEQAAQLAKAAWKLIGDELFSVMYLEMGEALHGQG